jgi:hypothetical protein
MENCWHKKTQWKTDSKTKGFLIEEFENEKFVAALTTDYQMGVETICDIKNDKIK